MKYPKIEKRAGNYRMQPMINGKRYSITAATEKECKYKYVQILAGIKQEAHVPLSVGKAIDKYIDLKEPVLSPSTIMVYRRYRKNYFQSLMNINLSKLTQEDVQAAVGHEVELGKSPKTIQNAHGLLSVVLKEYRPEFHLNTSLPQKRPHEIEVPTEAEMRKIWQLSRSTRYELPIVLASWLGLRMSEIRGLKYTDFVDGKVHIQRAMVRGSDGFVTKTTKSYSGDRWIQCPKQILDLINSKPKTSDYVCPIIDTSIYRGFINICEKAGVKGYRFHDLRHFAASEAHFLDVPDKYQMKRMGHRTDNMLKTVYQHTMRDKEDYFADIIDERMSALFSD